MIILTLSIKIGVYKLYILDLKHIKKWFLISLFSCTKSKIILNKYKYNKYFHNYT